MFGYNLISCLSTRSRSSFDKFPTSSPSSVQSASRPNLMSRDVFTRNLRATVSHHSREKRLEKPIPWISPTGRSPFCVFLTSAPSSHSNSKFSPLFLHLFSSYFHPLQPRGEGGAYIDEKQREGIAERTGMIFHAIMIHSRGSRRSGNIS